MADYETINVKQISSEHDSFTLKRYQQFFRYLPKSARYVLDVGCNTGRGGRVLKELNPDFKIVGLDCVSARLNMLPEDVYDQALHCYTTQINLEDGSMDAIVAGEFVEHLLPADVQKTMGEFFRVLKKGGVLLLTTPNPNYIRLKFTGESVLNRAHLSQHYPMTLTNHLKRMGFSRIMVRGSGKVSRFLGDRCPILSFYGSYLLRAEKME